LRGAHVEHLDDALQGVAGAHRGQPAQLVEARRADARFGKDAALDEQPEAHRDRLEAAGDEPAVGRVGGGVGVEVEGLRVVAEGEVDDLGLGEGEAAAHEAVAGLQVVQVAGVHGVSPRY
jgi:hypothetical protein